MTDATYVAYSEDVEKQRPDEDALITSTVEALGRSNQQAYKKYKHGIRDAHAKSHGVLRGELTVYPDLASHLRQGLFATPATYPVIARISSAAGESGATKSTVCVAWRSRCSVCRDRRYSPRTAVLPRTSFW
jgi:hypothetical protein